MRAKGREARQVCFGGLYSPLTDDAIIKIDDTSMSIFEEVGVKITYRPILERWREAGADIDEKQSIARLDRNVIKKCLAMAPKEILLGARDHNYDMVLSGARTYLGSSGTAINIIDLYSGECRPTNIYDVAAMSRMSEACKNIDFTMVGCYPCELQKDIVDINRFYATICNTAKHICGSAYTVHGVNRLAHLVEMIAGSKEAFKKSPFVSLIAAVMSPLVIGEEHGRMLEAACLAGFPLHTPCAPISGSTAPVTLAGALVQMNVESLMAVITAQLIEPGHPTLYSAVPTTIDLRTGAFCFGSIETAMLNAAASQIARFYSLPSYVAAGVSESKNNDTQSSYESSCSVLLNAMAGGNFIHDAAGLLESGLTASLAKYVIDDEVIGITKRVLKGINVDDDTLASECIKKVGPAGNYLSEEHTLSHMRREHFYPDLADRSSRTAWESDGKKSMEEKARLAAIDIMKQPNKCMPDSFTDTAIRKEFPEILGDTGKLYSA